MFFDLNLSAPGGKDHSRRETVAMAMQLGYTGVAINHLVNGQMQESDRCKILPLSLETLLAAVPEARETAAFHRKLLGVPAQAPFRQYTRITVPVDDLTQASALNSGNPLLQTYDVVAVQPLNQKMFAQACTTLEVDLISLNLSQKMDFKAKSSALVKAAVERGVFFEIVYGAALVDTKARRELFANAQSLVAGTRGRNLVLSSGAGNSFEIRGPNDVANLSTLFGLTLEQAKLAVSKNANSVLLRGIARKKTYKAAVAIEPLFDVPAVWDPLSTPEEYTLQTPPASAPAKANAENPRKRKVSEGKNPVAGEKKKKKNKRKKNS